MGNQNGTWAGLHITKVSRLWISANKFIELKHPNYQICFCPNADTSNILPLVDEATLSGAKKLAEWYYTEWLRVNQNFDTQIETLYPLAKRLEGRADGQMVRSDNGGIN
jgi:hypothetical protein